jgi:uncharacterized glyoxalase superfamily protein PhnB
MTNSSSSTDGAAPAPASQFNGSRLMASLTVKDIQTSLAWYRDVVGFTVERTYPPEGTIRGAAIRAGDVALLLNQDDGAQGWERVKGEGISFQITTSQRVDDIADRITSHGGTLDSQPADMPWGARAFRVRDPDGFKFAISSERSA